MKQLQYEVYYLESACMFVWFASDELAVLLLRTSTDVVGNPVADFWAVVAFVAVVKSKFKL